MIDIVKFYGCELGAQTKFDKKTGTSIVNGAHDTGKLVELLEVPAHVMLHSTDPGEAGVAEAGAVFVSILVAALLSLGRCLQQAGWKSRAPIHLRAYLLSGSPLRLLARSLFCRCSSRALV